MRASVFIATSLDGFIARADGALDWLPGADGAGVPPSETGYDAFMASVDVVVMGRGTWDKVMEMGGWFYGTTPVRVLTSRALKITSQVPQTVAPLSGTPPEIVAALSREGFRHAYVDGGRTIQAFLRDGLIQRLTLTRIPVLLGHGIPLFGTLPHDVQLKHRRTQVLGDAMVQSEYDVLDAKLEA